jgi:acyl transferase domain-containing protein
MARGVAFVFGANVDGRLVPETLARDAELCRALRRLDETVVAAGGGRVLPHVFLPEPGAAGHARVFAVQHALADVLVRRGVRPMGALGAGVGEFAATSVSGLLPAPDAVRCLLAHADAVARPALLAEERRLDRTRPHGVRPRPRVPRGPAARRFLAVTREVVTRPSRLLYVSASTAGVVEAGEVGVQLWYALRRPVRLVEAAGALAGFGARCFVDLGPGTAAADLLREAGFDAVSGFDLAVELAGTRRRTPVAA